MIDIILSRLRLGLGRILPDVGYPARPALPDMPNNPSFSCRITDIWRHYWISGQTLVGTQDNMYKAERSCSSIIEWTAWSIHIHGPATYWLIQSENLRIEGPPKGISNQIYNTTNSDGKRSPIVMKLDRLELCKVMSGGSIAFVMHGPIPNLNAKSFFIW